MQKGIWWLIAATAALACSIVNSAMARASNGLSPSGEFVVLDSQAQEASIFIAYPTLGGNNCGIRILVDQHHNYSDVYSSLASSVEVLDLDGGPLTLVASGRRGNIYEFGDMNFQFYGTTVNIRSQIGQFQKVFEKIKGNKVWLKDMQASVAASTVSCALIAEAKRADDLGASLTGR